MTTNQHDFLNRLPGVSSAPSAGWEAAFSYGHNSANERANVSLGDGASGAFGHDSE